MHSVSGFENKKYKMIRLLKYLEESESSFKVLPKSILAPSGRNPIAMGFTHGGKTKNYRALAGFLPFEQKS